MLFNSISLVAIILSLYLREYSEGIIKKEESYFTNKVLRLIFNSRITLAKKEIVLRLITISDSYSLRLGKARLTQRIMNRDHRPYSHMIGL